ncbi:hypothetical protein [Helicobacter sp. T3_23-1059]
MEVELKPDITYQKGLNAISSYCDNSISYDDILFLLDDTMFGSAKDGIVVTRDYLFAKESYESPESIEIKNIKTLELKKTFTGMSKLVINGKKFGSFSIDYDELSPFLSSLETLQETIKIRKMDSNADGKQEYDGVVQADSIFKRIHQDRLIQYLRSSKNTKTVMGLAGIAIDLLTSGNTSFSQKNASEQVREEVCKFLASVTIQMREQIERLNVIGLQNDVATREFLIYSVALLGLEMQRRRIDEEIILNVLAEGLREVFDNEPQVDFFVNIALENAMNINDTDDLMFSFYTRLFLTNYIERTISANMYEVAEVVQELYEQFEIDIDEYDDDEERGAALMMPIFEKISDILVKKYCARKRIF